MVDETIKVTCPECNCVLVIRRRDGELLEVRKPLLEESTGDRFQDAFQKVKKRGAEVENKVESAKQKERDRLKGADDFFKQALERAKDSDEKPINPMDYQ